MQKIRIQFFFLNGVSLYTDFRILSWKTPYFVRVDPYSVLNTENLYLVLNTENPYFFANNTESPFLTLFSIEHWKPVFSIEHVKPVFFSQITRRVRF